MLDVALVSLIQDMSEKAGVEGTIQYWARVGESLAKRMGKEAYMGWPSFNVALREGRTAFSIEGDVTALTDLAITDVDGDVVGYIYALEECVFVPTILRWFPNARIICIVRDGRDVVRSLCAAPWTHDDPLRHAMDWKRAARRCRAVAAKFPDNVRLVRLEDLLRDPVSLISDVDAFLGLGITDVVFEGMPAPRTPGSG